MTPIYLTTDTHFNHAKLHEVFGDRPADFEQKILKSHAELPIDCLLIHLGDFCRGNDQLMHNRWNRATGHINHRILIHGNHDNKSDSWYLAHGWDFVCRSTIMRLFGKNILFSHVPKDHTHYPSTDLNIHGHTHANDHRQSEYKDIYDPSYHIEIALEMTGYKPVLLNQKFLENK
jgi:calcineurin-like phosphoesterase family protein